MILEQIVKNKILEVELLEDLPEKNLQKSSRNFLNAFLPGKLGIIAELKSQSPSEGIICRDYHPEQIALEYTQGGANAISVLTDEKFFGGSFTHLKKVREATDLPLLCKDFLIDPRQIKLARHAGADACLLILSILDDEKLFLLKEKIESLGMTAFLEVFDAAELERALRFKPKLIGINNRDLKNFSLNVQNALELSTHIPEEIKVVAASGVKNPHDVWHYPKRINGVLIGTALMRSDNRVEFLRAMREIQPV